MWTWLLLGGAVLFFWSDSRKNAAAIPGGEPATGIIGGLVIDRGAGGVAYDAGMAAAQSAADRRLAANREWLQQQSDSLHDLLNQGVNVPPAPAPAPPPPEIRWASGGLGMTTNNVTRRLF